MQQGGLTRAGSGLRTTDSWRWRDDGAQGRRAQQQQLLWQQLLWQRLLRSLLQGGVLTSIAHEDGAHTTPQCTRYCTAPSLTHSRHLLRCVSCVDTLALGALYTARAGYWSTEGWCSRC